MRLRRFILHILLVVGSCITVTCTDFQEEVEPASFGVDVDELTFTKQGSFCSVTVSSCSKWDVGSMPQWISLKSITRSERSPYEWTAIFSATENDEYHREGTIIIKAGSDKAEISVAQEGKKGKYIAVESVSLSVTEMTLAKGETRSLPYAISPANASIRTVSWTSSSSTVASVDDSGLITAIAPGNTTITIRTKDGEKTAECNVTVDIPVNSVTLNKSAISMIVGDTQKLTANVLPTDALDKSVTWSSSDTGVATVSSSGLVTAVAPGYATITVKTNDGGKTASCSVEVKAIAVTSVSLNKTSVSLFVGYSEGLLATVLPENATNKAVTWSSSNSLVASVSSSGTVTALKVGTATITVTTEDGGKKATCAVTVQPINVTGVSLNKYSLSMYENDSETLVATITPSNATNKTVSWSSDNTAVATVSSNGQVFAQAAGSAVITVTTEDGQKTATCSVSVQSDPYGAVDLGLSVKWASYNYGASSVTSTGGYYMWGDPTGTGQPMFFTPPSVNNISGSQYDIVRSNWGGNWRIPTRSEINELYSNCTWTSTTLNGISVLKVTGKNGACIYLPFTGYGMPDDGPVGTVTVSDSNKVYMMSSESYGDSYGRFVYVVSFSSSCAKSNVSYNASFVKFPIRPVR